MDSVLFLRANGRTAKAPDHKVSTLMQVSVVRTQTHWLSRILTFVLSAWTALLLCSLINLFVLSPAGWDQSWYLYAAHRVMSGAQLNGPQLVEVDPPLVIWFSTIPVFLARLLHLDPLVMLKLVVLVMIAGSLLWSARILRAVFPAMSPGFLYLALSSLLSADIFLHGFDVGQREQILVILVVPYILSRVYGERSKLTFAELCAIGAIGGAAVCFKPHQVLILVALELFIAAWTRSLRQLARPDFLCAIVAILTYIAAVRLATPYFSAMVPVLLETYWAYGPYSALHLIEAKSRFNLILLLAIVIFLWRRRTLRFGVVSGAFLACSLAASIAFYIQHTGWTYHAYPFEAFLLLAVLWIILDLLFPYMAAWDIRSSFAVSTLLLALVLLVPVIIYRHHRAQYEAAHKPYVETIFAQCPPQTPVYLFSTSIDNFSVVLEHHLVWASRFAHLWMLPAILQNEIAEAGGPPPGKVLPAEVVAKLAALQRSETTEDFQRWKPAVVIVRQYQNSELRQNPNKLDFDPLAWFLRSPQFAAEWANYRLKTRHGDYDVYTRIP